MSTRRSFLKSGAALGGMMILPTWSIGKTKGPNSKLNVAFVGVGGRGEAAVNQISKLKDEANLAAFCDVLDDGDLGQKWYKSASYSYKRFPHVPRFRDYRVMLDKFDKYIDAVVVATPDHMHYPIAAWAIAKGKAVYCEKPLTRTIWEAEELKRLAKKAGVITQMGNQGHTNEGWRLVKEWYEAGILGQIEDIYCWTNRPIWPQGELTMPPAQKVPSTLDYKLWLGVAPCQPYNKAILPFNWRGLRNYGTGAVGDMGCHFLDVPYSGLDLGFPSSIVAESTPFNDYSWPSAASSVMTFTNKRGVDNRIRLHWYDGGRRPKKIKRVDEAFLKDPRNNNCTFIVGTKATVKTNEYGSGTMIYPREKMVEMVRSKALPPKSIERSKDANNPHAEWVHACLEGRQCPGGFDYAAPFTEMALLGMIAITQPGKELRYMPRTMEFLDNPEATRQVRSLYDYKQEFLPSRIRL